MIIQYILLCSIINVHVIILRCPKLNVHFAKVLVGKRWYLMESLVIVIFKKFMHTKGEHLLWDGGNITHYKFPNVKFKIHIVVIN